MIRLRTLARRDLPLDRLLTLSKSLEYVQRTSAASRISNAERS